MGMLVALACAIASYLVTSFLGYIVHWMMHQRWAGPLRVAHMAHHIVLYPPKNLMSESYRSAGSSSSVWTFLAVLIPLMLLPVALALGGVISLWSAGLAVIAMALVGITNDIIHDSFHVIDHPLSKVIPGYKRMQELHFVHHRNMKRNFGIYSFVCDRLFKTHLKR